MKMSTLSVCIATHERPRLLEQTLFGLERQVRQPDEIIVSDSSSSHESEAIARSFAEAQPHLTLKYVKSDRKALPWQRWWAFTHSSGETVLFLDDDVHLVPSALQVLEEAWSTLARLNREAIAGVGFSIAWEDGEMMTRDRASFTERWLATSNEQSGTVTAGGLAVSLDDLRSELPLRVDRLLGGAMCFRRQVLESVGPLDHLVALYEQRVGRGEDVVLSYYARKHGSLYLVARPLALHPRISAERAPYACDGWNLGLTATWGRAHTLRWMATDWSAYKRAWMRIATLELARCAAGIFRRPHLASSWSRMGGAFCGILYTVGNWHQIPSSARSVTPPNRLDRASLEPTKVHEFTGY